MPSVPLHVECFSFEILLYSTVSDVNSQSVCECVRMEARDSRKLLLILFFFWTCFSFSFLSFFFFLASPHGLQDLNSLTGTELTQWQWKPGNSLFWTFIYLFTFCPLCTACPTLVPLRKLNPCPPVVEAQSCNHWTIKEIPIIFWTFKQQFTDIFFFARFFCCRKVVTSAWNCVQVHETACQCIKTDTQMHKAASRTTVWVRAARF